MLQAESLRPYVFRCSCRYLYVVLYEANPFPSYICRDGTTRRWMCHGFLAARDSGERLSHAVGCAFAACLERKQRRDKECAVSMSIDAASHAFTRQGSFRKSGN